MIIADLLKHRLFPDFEFIAGSTGLNREITAVSVIDSPDVDRWMRGGEFLIGSGYIFRESPGEFIPFLRRANEKGTAAVGIKLDRYMHQLPHNLVEVADELGLPLFRIPLNYRWTDVIEIVQNYLSLEKQRTQEVSIESLGNFWSEGFDIKELMSGFAKKLQRPLLISSDQLNINHCFAPNGEVEDAEISQYFPRVTVSQEKTLPLHGQILGHMELRDSDPPIWNVVYRIVSDTPITIRVRLAIGEQMLSQRQERLALRAMTLLRAEALEIAVMTTKRMANRERFFEGLCLDAYSNPGMIHANLRDMGIKFTSKSRIAMVTPIFESAPLNWEEPYSILNYRLGNIWVGLIPFKNNKDVPFSLDGTQTKEDDYFITLGGPVKSPHEVSRSYREARRTLTWVRNFSLKPGIYQHDELSLYALLGSLIRLPEATSVWKRYWEPLLLDSSEKKRIITLKELAIAMIEADFNARLCSLWLHLHYNTVRNYIEDMEHLLGVDLSLAHHKTGLTLAYYIEKSRKRNEIDLFSPTSMK